MQQEQLTNVPIFTEAMNGFLAQSGSVTSCPHMSWRYLEQQLKSKLLAPDSAYPRLFLQGAFTATLLRYKT